MTRKLCIALLMTLLCLLWALPALAVEYVTLPDQYITVEKWRSACVQRMEGTEITSFDRDQEDRITTTMTGMINADAVGETLLILEEYDALKDIHYRTNIHVTVLPRDESQSWGRDNSYNSQQMIDWQRQNGNNFAVGQQYSVRMICLQDGQELPLEYYSNRPEVATVDSEGMVTMRAPGTAAVMARVKGGYASQAFYLIVHDGAAWESNYADFSPADPGERLNIYQQPDASSKVLSSIGRWETEHFYVLSRGDVWTKVSASGYLGYVESAKLTFRGQELPQRAPIATPCTLYVVASYSGTLSLMSSPDNQSNYVMGNYRTDTAVYATEIVGDYALVQVDGKTGYMQLSFLTAVKPENPILNPSQQPDYRWMQVQNKTGEPLILWKQAATGVDVLGRYENGTLVKAYYGGWGDMCKVEVDGQIGYMLERCLVAAKAPEDVPVEELNEAMIVRTGNSGKLNLRSEPASGCKVLAQYANGTPVIVRQRLGEWAKVEVEGQTGYMQLKFLTAAPASEGGTTPPAVDNPNLPQTQGIMIVRTGNGGKLNLRSMPRSGGKVLGQYDNGTVVGIVETQGEWAYVVVDGQTGYMMLKYLVHPIPTDPNLPQPDVPYQPDPSEPSVPSEPSEPSEGEKPVQTATVVHPEGSYVNLRNGAHTSFRVLAEVPSGTVVTVLFQETYWAKVVYAGVEGYIATRYLQ